MTAPRAEAVAAAAAASPLSTGPAFTQLAADDELAFREHVEPYPDPVTDVPRFIEGKELVRKLHYALAQAGIEPAGTVVELGAGTCWLSAELAKLPKVERVFAVEFSRRRIQDFAPIAIAYIGAPAEKIQRVLADFYEPGLPPGSADLVFTDASFHHAADPDRLARGAAELLRPGGEVVLFREPTVSWLRRTREHGLEAEHGSFEREYRATEYLDCLRRAGLDARKAPASGGWRTPRARALLHPPLSWLNGVLYSEFTYVGRKPT